MIEIPTFLSMPHYLFGDESLLNNNKGLKPNFTKHKSIIYFEPLTGIPLKANKRGFELIYSDLILYFL